MAISDWSATELCIDADLVVKETDVLQWTGNQQGAQKWRDDAKEMIGHRLDFALKEIEIATDETDVKDLISNLGQLKNPAVYLSLHLLANDVSAAPGDLYDHKAQMYLGKYEDELPRAIALLHVDTDESGTIEDTEKYNAPTGVTLKLGG